jgi:hypothetical protein
MKMQFFSDPEGSTENMYEASIPEYSFRKTGVCNVITKKIFAKYVLNSDLRPQMLDYRSWASDVKRQYQIDTLCQVYTVDSTVL